MGRPLPVGRNLAAELEDDADDDDDDDEQGVAPGDRPPLIPRATRNGSTRLTESRRSERRDDRRDDRRDYRRDDRRTRRDDGRDRRVTVAATADDEEEDGMECQPSRRLSQHGYDDDESDYSREAYSDSEGGSDHDHIDAGLADEKSRGRNGREDSTRSQKDSTRLSGARLDLKGARLSSGTRLINQLIPLAEPTGSLTAEILMDRVQRVAARGTQCTSVASAAIFVSRYTMWGDANCSSATNDWSTLSPRMSTNPSCQTTSRTSTRRAI
ncbi:unnamed protein product [Phytophthora fragariaefolia]|uniref:Unnamed protein product n=1 Tax=Phytophthora fragariaefolia TaxID=1490495 RepID=A0A9W6Y9F4_9STRA|nr:unnamed protein product [Phytophthora fragariaefolia]